MAIPEPPECQNGFIYTVKQGDTLFLIARRFGIRLEDLIAANPQISDPNQIMPGQRICVPVPQTPECPNGTIYTVEKGDSLYTIAQRQGTTVQAILAVNPQITDPNLIIQGQKICIPAATTPEPPMPYPPPPPCPEGFIYTVQSGDSLYSIAQRYGTTLGAIVAANPQISDPNVIQPGQRVCVPIAPAPPCPTGFIYTVQGGENLYAIAARFGTTVPAIMAVNPQITNPNVIYPGQKICIPIAPAPECPSGMLYTVMQGDTIYTIATKYGTTVPAIMAANPQITDPNLIYPGQKICIPETQHHEHPKHHEHYPHHMHYEHHKHPDHQKPPHAVYCPNGFVYIARQGDTLYTIGQRFGVGLEAMIEANPQITDPNLIYPGQRICVPRQPWWPWPGPWGPCHGSGAEMAPGVGTPAPSGHADHHHPYPRPTMCIEYCRRMYPTAYGGEAGHVTGCCYNDPHPEHNRLMVWAAGLPAPGKYPGSGHKYYYAWAEARNGDRVHWRLSEYDHCWTGCYYPKQNRCWVRMYVTVEKDKDPKRPSDKVVLDTMPGHRGHTG